MDGFDSAFASNMFGLIPLQPVFRASHLSSLLHFCWISLHSFCGNSRIAPPRDIFLLSISILLPTASPEGAQCSLEP